MIATATTTVAPAAMRTDKTGFEVSTCGRCGGAGNYSFNQVHGSTCYGCGGTGIVRTKRGAAARAHMIALQMRHGADVQVGDFIWADRWCKVVGIVKGTHGRVVDGKPTVWCDSWDLGKGKDGYARLYGVCDSIRSVRNEAHRMATIAAALAYQATLGVSGKPLKKLAK